MTFKIIGFGTLLLMLVCSGPGFAVVFESPGDTQVAPPENGARKQAIPPAMRPNMTADRGELLYENHCQGCHQSTAHIRSHRRANSVEAIQAWVQRWADDSELGWDEGAILAVTDYLNRRYYKIGLPEKK